MYGLLFTFIALVALLGIVFVRTRAQSSPVNQLADVPLTQMTIDSQDIIQLQNGTITILGYNVSTQGVCPGADCPTYPQAILTPGSLSTPIHFIAHITVPNGVVNTILQPHAAFGIDIWNANFSQKAECSLTSCANNEISIGASNDNPDSTDIPVAQYVSLDPDHPGDPTKAMIDVPIPLPYYTLPNEWNVSWSLDPVDANGNQDTNYELNNSTGGTRGSAAPLFFQIADLVAMDVSPSELMYGIRGGNTINPLTPDTDSDSDLVVARVKGNVALNVSAYGDPSGWTSSLNSQTMPTSITHFGQMLQRFGVTNIDTHTDWNYGDGSVLGGGIGNKSPIFDYWYTGPLACSEPDPADCPTHKLMEVPMVHGDQAGNQDPNSIISELAAYDTKIHTPVGVSGVFHSTLWNIASKSTMQLYGKILTPNPEGDGGKGGGGKGGPLTFSVTSVIPDSNNPVAVVTGQIVSGDTMGFMLDNDGTVKMIDLSTIYDKSQKPALYTPNNASIVGTTTVGAGPRHAVFSIQDQRLITSNYTDHSFSIVDVTTSPNPTLLTTYALGYAPEGIYINGSMLFVTDGANDLVHTYNLIDVNAITEVGSIAVGSHPSDVSACGEYAFVTNYNDNTLSVVHFGQMSPDMIVTQTASIGPHPKSLASIAGVCTSLYATSDNGTISVIDTSANNGNVSVLSSVGLGLGSVPVSASESGWLFTADSTGDTVSVIDGSTPALASEIAHVSISAVGSDAFVVSSNYGFEIVHQEGGK